MPHFADEYCCCFNNRVGCCENCCGCWGPITGNPITYHSFSPQPANVEEFCAVAQQTMNRTQNPTNEDDEGVTHLDAVVPPTATPGTVLHITMPSGKGIPVAVPAGCQPGTTLRVATAE